MNRSFFEDRRFSLDGLSAAVIGGDRRSRLALLKGSARPAPPRLSPAQRRRLSKRVGGSSQGGQAPALAS